MTIRDIRAKIYEVIKWSSAFIAAFMFPESTGIWFIWGNSGNGKSEFLMQLVKELSKNYKVAINALEEGGRMTMQQRLNRYDFEGFESNVGVTEETFEEMCERLDNRRSPHVYIIDSIQHLHLTFKQYQYLKQRYRHKLIIFISHAEGKKPEGRVPVRIKYDADLKIWIEGLLAISHGRQNINGKYVIWDEGAREYWGNEVVETIQDKVKEINRRNQLKTNQNETKTQSN